jgi:hypothetical protein
VPIRCRRKEPEATVVLDAHDDIAVLYGILDRCSNISGSVAISPTPSACGNAGLYTALCYALRAKRRSKPRSDVSPRYEWLSKASWAQRGHWDLTDFADKGGLWRAGVRELFVLRAHTIPDTVWRTLGDLAWLTEVHLHMVVHGQRPTVGQLAGLEGCIVRTIDGRGFRRSGSSAYPAIPWWARPR